MIKIALVFLYGMPVLPYLMYNSLISFLICCFQVIKIIQEAKEANSVFLFDFLIIFSS